MWPLRIEPLVVILADHQTWGVLPLLDKNAPASQNQMTGSPQVFLAQVSMSLRKIITSWIFTISPTFSLGKYWWQADPSASRIPWLPEIPRSANLESSPSLSNNFQPTESYFRSDARCRSYWPFAKLHEAEQMRTARMPPPGQDQLCAASSWNSRCAFSNDGRKSSAEFWWIKKRPENWTKKVLFVKS